MDVDSSTIMGKGMEDNWFQRTVLCLILSCYVDKKGSGPIIECCGTPALSWAEEEYYTLKRFLFFSTVQRVS